MEEQNPFKKIAHPPQETPSDFKVKVMSEIARIKLFQEMANLFILNYPKAAKTFFEKNKKS
tara:strand:- start:882 stop:1064 length:183 start_codon:yes stop_codon:yes gene_type:complete